MFFTFWNDLGNTPARVNRFTGEIQISRRHFDKMPQFHKDFIIQHERGHFIKNTRSEFDADKFAFRQMAGTAPRSLKESVKSISQVLSFRNPEHLQRMTEVVKMALEYDYKNNGNVKALNALNELNDIIFNQKQNKLYIMNSTSNDYFNPKFGDDSEYGDIYDNAKGKARRQARKAKRVTRRAAKKQTRVAKKQTRVAKRKAFAKKVQSKFPLRRKYPNIGNNADRSFVERQLPEEEILMEESYPVEQTQYPAASYPEPEYPQDEYPEEEFLEDSEYPEESEYPDDEYPEEEYPEDFVGMDGQLDDDSYYDNGAGKARRAARRADRKKKKDERIKLRSERKAARNDVIKSRADAKRIKAEAKMELAKQGKSGSDWLSGAIDSVAGIFGGGKKDEAEDYPMEPGTIEPDPNAGKILGMPKGVAIAVIAILVISIIGVVIFVVMKKKK